MPRDFASISSPIRTRHRRISGLHRWEPTCPPRTPHGASLSLETVAHLQLLLDTPSRVPGSLSVPRSSWYSRSAPLPHRCRIPFVRAPGQDLRLPALTSDLLAMPVTLLDNVTASPASRRLASARAKPGTRPLLILGQAPRIGRHNVAHISRWFTQHSSLWRDTICLSMAHLNPDSGRKS